MKRLCLLTVAMWLACGIGTAAGAATLPLGVYVASGGTTVSDPASLPYRRTDTPFAKTPLPLRPEVVWMRIEPRDMPGNDAYAIAFRPTSTERVVFIPHGGGFQEIVPSQSYYALPRLNRPIYARAVATYGVLPRVLPLQIAELDERRNISWSQFFVGFFIAIGLFNLLLFVVLRDPPFLWYAGIMASMIAVDAVTTPLLRPYIDRFGPATPPILRVVALWAYFICIVFFSRSFLRLRRQLPALDLTILGILALNLMAIPAEGLLNELWPLANLDDLLLSSLLGGLLLAGVLMYRRGESTARYYIIAFAGAALGILVNDAGERLNFRPEWVLNMLQMGIAWEALFLAVALADRTHRIAVENEQLGIAKIHAEVLASQDGLTGVPNRRAFDLALDNAWRAATRLGESLAVVILDVDDFKHFNDTNGHLAGDDVLRKIAHACEDCSRHGVDTFARFGGEEFAAVLPRASAPEAAAIAERMRASAESLGILQADGTPVTISIGVAISRPLQGDLSQDLVGAADAALYSAKASGKNRAAIA